jgi:hypothetical protein
MLHIPEDDNLDSAIATSNIISFPSVLLSTIFWESLEQFSKYSMKILILEEQGDDWILSLKGFITVI